MKTRLSFLIVCCIAATAVAARPDGGEQGNTATPPTKRQTHHALNEERLAEHLRRDGVLLEHLKRSPERTALMWRQFALDVGLSDADLAAFRAAVPQAGDDDLAWIREVEGMSEMWLEALWPSDAHDLLFSMTEMQLLLKQWADSHYGKPILRPSDPPALEAELWRRFEPQIGSFADMKARMVGDGLFTAVDVLWVHTAKEYDAAMLQVSSVTAAQLLTMPDYQLQRKLVVDSHVSTLVDCVRCALNPTPACSADRCENQYTSLVKMCENFAKACEAAGRLFGRACRAELERCTCGADCGRCTCLGGQLGSGGSCIAQCRDGEHDCTAIGPLSQP